MTEGGEGRAGRKRRKDRDMGITQQRNGLAEEGVAVRSPPIVWGGKCGARNGVGGGGRDGRMRGERCQKEAAARWEAAEAIRSTQLSFQQQ